MTGKLGVALVCLFDRLLIAVPSLQARVPCKPGHVKHVELHRTGVTVWSRKLTRRGHYVRVDPLVSGDPPELTWYPDNVLIWRTP